MENYFTQGVLTPDEIDPIWLEGALMDLAVTKDEGRPTDHMRQQLQDIVVQYIAAGKCIAPRACAKLILDSKDVGLARWTKVA